MIRDIWKWNNHKIHGKWKYLNINKVGWIDEFKDGKYYLKIKVILNEEKRISIKMKKLKNFMLFL